MLLNEMYFVSMSFSKQQTIYITLFSLNMISFISNKVYTADLHQMVYLREQNLVPDHKPLGKQFPVVVSDLIVERLLFLEGEKWF